MRFLSQPTARNTGKPTRAVAHMMALVLLLTITGCGGLQASPISELTLHHEAGVEEPLASRFDHGLYSYDGPDMLTVVLVQGTFEQPERAVTMRMFWQPAAGSTPIDRAATNTTIHYMVFKPAPEGGRRVAVYSGAGFLYPGSHPGAATLHAGLWGATMRLTDASGRGMNPRGGPSALSGNFTVQRDDAGVAQALRQLNIVVTEALTYPRLVRAGVDRVDLNR